jgi:2-C-methyl-D-erythritol 4-phosphate cytidylyltransferase
MNHVTAIVLAAGSGVRLASPIPKPLIKIGATPLIIYSLRTFNEHQAIDDIIVTAHHDTRERIIREINRYGISKVRHVILGGKRRQDSVALALRVLPQDTDTVLIHDGARPFVDQRCITTAISAVTYSGAAIVGVPVKNTIKRILPKGRHRCLVQETLPREVLYEIQTPQVFQKDLIQRAYKRYGREKATDDAMLVEKLGGKVSVVMGSYSNIKITTQEDLVCAQQLAAMNQRGE